MSLACLEHFERLPAIDRKRAYLFRLTFNTHGNLAPTPSLNYTSNLAHWLHPTLLHSLFMPLFHPSATQCLLIAPLVDYLFLSGSTSISQSCLSFFPERIISFRFPGFVSACLTIGMNARNSLLRRKTTAHWHGWCRWHEYVLQRRTRELCLGPRNYSILGPITPNCLGPNFCPFPVL